MVGEGIAARMDRNCWILEDIVGIGGYRVLAVGTEDLLDTEPWRRRWEEMRKSVLESMVGVCDRGGSVRC